MNKVDVSLENCFGIGELKHTFDFEELKSNTCLIYAPNGTMKSSFAKCFELKAKTDSKETPCDRIYTDRPTKCEIISDGNEINSEHILVVNTDDETFDSSKKITNFIASKELKEQYDFIYSQLNDRKTEFIKRLKSTSQSSDCESEFFNAFSQNTRDTFFELSCSVKDQLPEQIEKFNFRYNDIFDKKGNVKRFLEKNEKLLNIYVENYENLISNSSFFKKSSNSFGTYQANEILKSIEDNSFFDAGHVFTLDGNVKVDSAEKLNEIVQSEIGKILNDTKLKESFDKVDKAIGANVELRSFKAAIERDNLLLVELKDYEAFKQKVWLNYFAELKPELQELINFYISLRKELEFILAEAKKEFAIWKSIITKFNTRFYVPFTVLLSNQEDIVLKQETASLEFLYSDSEEPAVSQKKDNLFKILSKGELKAYFILQLLFDIESRKLVNNKSLIIFDDVADSFDYKNKYAIIEYIKDLHESNIFRMIVLTHNFDFYRTVASRLHLKRVAVFMATKAPNRRITLGPGQYINDVFPYFIKNVLQPRIFLSLIPFVRNLVEYTEGIDCKDYVLLTQCLHLKKGSGDLMASDIFSIFVSRFSNIGNKEIDFKDVPLIDLISKTAGEIVNEENLNEILLENKIVLSIAIRLAAERFMLSKLPDTNTDSISSNQTKKLYREFSSAFDNHTSLEQLEKVNLMTPENIHLNSFMYEPLIDMSVHHLTSLYKQIDGLGEI